MAPKIFFTADLHLGHSNIIRYCKRPFQTVEEMNEKLIENWNNTVSDRDEIYVVGDFAFMGTKQTEEILKRLRGRKYLLRGNHDKSLNETMALKYFKWIKDYYLLKVQEMLGITEMVPKRIRVVRGAVFWILRFSCL